MLGVINEIVSNFIEVEALQTEDFHKVAETLTRIGIASGQEKKLFQSCHILHKRGYYYIVHFKELFKLDLKDNNFSSEDMARRNTISNLLQEWGLVKLIDPSKSAEPVVSRANIKIITFRDKENWFLIPKYTIGNNIYN